MLVILIVRRPSKTHISSKSNIYIWNSFCVLLTVKITSTQSSYTLLRLRVTGQGCHYSGFSGFFRPSRRLRISYTCVLRPTNVVWELRNLETNKNAIRLEDEIDEDSIIFGRKSNVFGCLFEDISGLHTSSLSTTHIYTIGVRSRGHAEAGFAKFRNCVRRIDGRPMAKVSVIKKTHTHNSQHRKKLSTRNSLHTQ